MTTEKKLQSLFYRLNFDRYDLIATNIYLEWGSNEFDIFGLCRSGFVHEIEVKLTTKNYKDDFNKVTQEKELKHQMLQKGHLHSNYFSFFMPEDLVDKCDIPDYAGLFVYCINSKGEEKIERRKYPKLLHERKLSAELKYKAAKKMAARYWKEKL